MKKGFFFGLHQSVAIAIGYAPVAVTFGILSLKCGLSIWEASIMSLLVFAGASQFIAIELFNQGATIWVIGLTTLIVNIRHVLMSFSMLRFFQKSPLSKLMLLAQGITDETFVLNSKLLEEVKIVKERIWVTLGVNMGAFASWVIFTFIGALLGSQVTINFSGFDFALPALFIVLTVSTVNSKNFFTYLTAGLIAIILKLMIPGKIYLLLSVGIAAVLGAWVNRKLISYPNRQEEC